jgi:hypothetical protein
MKTTTTVMILLALTALAIVAIKLPRTTKAKTGRFHAKPIATAHEQKMFWRLLEAFPSPEFTVFTQVAFGAMLTAKEGASRNRFSQKMADFVVINKAFKVLATIELDDASHKGREREDANRDSMLIEAGYTVLRYAKIPSIETLRLDLRTDDNANKDTRPLTIGDLR